MTLKKKKKNNCFLHDMPYGHLFGKSVSKLISFIYFKHSEDNELILISIGKE